MATTRLYQVFCDLTNNLHGNTSTVILLNTPLSDSRMQQLASDLCQPATTFLHPLKHKNQFGVRWFAPDAEINVCGHGAAAALSFLADEYHTDAPFELHAAKGILTGKKKSDQRFQLELSAFRVTEELNCSASLKAGLGLDVLKHYKTTNKNIVLVASEKEVRTMKPNFEQLRKDGHFGYIVTAPGDKLDFVSRTLVPHVGQLEDPATGSSHATLTPFWSEKLGKTSMEAVQLSKRGGRFSCELKADRCLLSGQYQLLLKGEISP